jgi:DNA polymerase-3 subunit alpha (Gram-positive type)
LAKQELSDLPRYEIKLSSEKRPRQTGFEAVPFSNITPKGKYDEFVVFDTETTGLSPSKDRIIELAAVRFVDGKPTEVFETFINPEREIPQEVTSISHITNEMVCDAPSVSQVLPSFEAFVGKSALVAHNLEFDLKFLYYSGSTILDTKRKFFDTLEQAKKMLKKPKMKYDKEFEVWAEDYDSDFDVCDYKLETLCGYYKINIPMQHRAAADAIATGKLFLSLIEEKRYTFKV